MDGKTITVYIHDLNISDKSKSFLARAGLMRLSDLLSSDINDLSAMRGISDDVLRELYDVIAHAKDITNFFENRIQRINEILPEVQETPIGKLRLGTRSYNALKRADVHTVGDLIQMSQKDIFELRNVGVLSRNEITTAIESIIQSGKAVYCEDIDTSTSDTTAISEKNKITVVLSEVDSIPLDGVPFSERARNALRRADIQTAGALITLSENDILAFQGVGQQTKDEIASVISAILEHGKECFNKLSDGIADIPANDGETYKQEKGFDFPTIDLLLDKFGLKTAKMAEWFGLSRQSIYSTLEKRSPKQRSLWTGKVLSEKEREILTSLAENNSFDYTCDEVTCCCMNNKQDDFVCLFIYENEIKCFFLNDLPDDIRDSIVNRKMHMYTERELAGESEGQVVYVLTKPYFRPNNPDRFRANAQSRHMTNDDYSRFISGYPCLDQRNVTDNQIIAFMKENLEDGKVYISSDSKNQWIRSIASRNGYSIKDFIELYGFESGSEPTIDKAKKRHSEALRKYIVHDNVVYLPTDSHIYMILSTYAYNKGVNMNDYIRSLGFERTTERPSVMVDVFEEDMEIGKSDGTFEEKVFAMYPLIGSRILKPETVDKLNDIARKYIDLVLREPSTKLPPRAKMQITLAIINNAKNWNNEENSNFWNYISLQFGYRDVSGSVVRLLQSSLESAMKQNRRLFWEDANGRAFKSTVVTHALSTRKSWMALFDFLFDFYRNNLNWRAIPNDPLIAVMIHALQQKLSGNNEEDTELTISSKVYSFQEGIRKLILYRPVYTRGLFEKLIGKIDSLVNTEVKPVKTYEEQLCEDWFKEKIAAISNTKRTEKRIQSAQRDVAIDYSRIRAKYLLQNETDVQLVIPDIRLKNENIERVVLSVTCNGINVIQQKLSWYGNELGKTLNGISVSLPTVPQSEKGIDLQVVIMCDDEVIYSSEESLNRSILLFYGSTEVAVGQIKRDRYTLIVPASSMVETDNADVTEIDGLKNAGLKAYFLELKDGYVVTVNERLTAFDNENGTDIRVVVPSESKALPMITLRGEEAYFAYRESFCSIILGSSEYLQRFVLQKNGKKIDFASLQQSDNGLAFTFPLNEDEDRVHLQIINLAAERPVFDRIFMLITESDCCFNREFYYSADDYKDAEYYVDIDDFREVIPFTKDDTEIRVPFRDGELHVDIPKVDIQETSGEWLQEMQPAWYIGAIPQESFLKVTKPPTVDIRFLVGGEDIMYDGQGLVTIGNVLQTLTSTEDFDCVNVEMRIAGSKQIESYTIANVYYKEQFLKSPTFRSEEHKLFWDHGGAFIGNTGREFTLVLTGIDEITYEFKLDENTEYIALPDDIPIGNFRYEISIQSGGLFKRIKEVVAIGDCIIGDKNLLRFINRRIVVDSITDESKEEAGHIRIRTCYIDHIQFCGMEDTSDGYCPVYSGVLYTTGYHNKRYEFSYDVHTNEKGITKTMVNPVRIVYISDTTLCITDADGDGLYYYNFYDRNLGSVVYALTDREYTRSNKHKYSNADLYSYRTERI